MLVNRNNLNLIFKNLEARFNRALADTSDLFWMKVAMRMPSAGAETVHQWLSRFPEMREWIGERTIKALQGFQYTVRNKDFESTIEVDRNDIEDDNLGIYGSQAAMAGESAARLPDQLVADLLNNGFTSKCFDGKAFFASGHPHAGVKAGWSNKSTKALDISTLAKAKASYGAARIAMMKAKDENGRPIGIKPTHLVVPPDLEDEGRALVTVDRLEDGKPNIYKGSADVVSTARLTSSTAWFLFDLSRSVKPLIYQERLAPTVEQLSDPQSERVFMQRKFLFGARARGAGGYGFPQFAHGSDGTVA